MTGSAQLEALGTGVSVIVTNPHRLSDAVVAVVAELELVDATCSRFRVDSELMSVEPGLETQVSPLLYEALGVAVHAAETTDGLVDPTVGGALVGLGYDRDYANVCDSESPPPTRQRVPSWTAIHLDRDRHTVAIDADVTVDLGATGKALAADRAATRAALAADCGVLVNLGGDISVAGSAPDGGWPIGIADSHRESPELVDQTVVIHHGGIATSSVTTRKWTRSGVSCHHIVDPALGISATVVWRTVSVAAASCVTANTLSTAAIVDGASALGRLARLGLPARLVAADGSVVTVGGWPADAARLGSELSR